MGSIEYHKRELEIAKSTTDHRSILPNVLDSDKTILDIGCGIGQSFIALDCTDKTCIGMDIDEEAIAYGIEKYGNDIQYILSDAKRIPMPSNGFDLAFSRVSLPYTNIPQVVKEVKRVLKKDGRIWMTLHNWDIANEYWEEAKKSRNIKRLLHVSYILANGYCLKYFGFLFPFLNGRYESWQDIPAMKKLLTKNGFEVNVTETNEHTVIEGTLKQS